MSKLVSERWAGSVVEQKVDFENHFRRKNFLHLWSHLI